MNAIWQVIKEAATSKKFITAIAGSITAAALKIGLELPTETVSLVLAPILTYLISQGWADRGVEAAKVGVTADLAVKGIVPVEEVKVKLL